MNLHRMNPLDIVIAIENHSCKGCAREMRVRFGEDIRIGCTLGRRHGERCKKYTNDTRKGNDGRQD